MRWLSLHWIFSRWISIAGQDRQKNSQDSDREFSGHYGGTGNPGCTIGEDAGTLEDVYEPYLLQNGFLTELRGGAQRPHLPTNISESTGFHDFQYLHSNLKM